jgi:hypothetical protein
VFRSPLRRPSGARRDAYGPYALGLDAQIRRAPRAACMLVPDQQLAPEQGLTHGVRRRQMKATSEEVRVYLGVKLQRQWNARATARPTPAVSALSSMVTLIAAHVIGLPNAAASGGVVSASARPLFRHHGPGMPLLVEAVPGFNLRG